MADIRVTAKDKDGEDFSAKLTPRKGAEIDLAQIKQSFEKMGMTNVVVKYRKQVSK